MSALGFLIILLRKVGLFGAEPGNGACHEPLDKEPLLPEELGFSIPVPGVALSNTLS